MVRIGASVELVHFDMPPLRVRLERFEAGWKADHGGRLPTAAEMPIEVADLYAQFFKNNPHVAAAAAVSRAARTEADADERAVREAEREAATATRELTRIDEKLGQARERTDLVAERLAGLRADLARIEAEEAERRERIAALEDERRAAASVARDAEKKAERARRIRGSET